MKDYIDIFDHGEYIGKTKFDHESFSNGQDMVMINVIIPINDEKTVRRTVLFIRTMDYGILIPEDVADHMRSVCEV